MERTVPEELRDKIVHTRKEFNELARKYYIPLMNAEGLNDHIQGAVEDGLFYKNTWFAFCIAPNEVCVELIEKK